MSLYTVGDVRTCVKHDVVSHTAADSPTPTQPKRGGVVRSCDGDNVKKKKKTRETITRLGWFYIHTHAHIIYKHILCVCDARV